MVRLQWDVPSTPPMSGSGCSLTHARRVQGSGGNAISIDRIGMCPISRHSLDNGKVAGVVGSVFTSEHLNDGELEICQQSQKKQQMAAGAALAAKQGKRSKSSLKGASKQMAESMSEKQLKDFAKTKRGKLPEKKES